jgi:UDP-2,3-diacylglucosamine pyrophosphatase LpxH
MTQQKLPNTYKVKTLWISDVHLGTKDCKANYLLDLLSTLECETLFLVGDIVDLWAMKRRIYWPVSHNRVIRRILKLSKKGTRVIYIPGNHDYPARELAGEMFGKVEVHNKFLYETVHGKQLLVQHGDEFDGIIRFPRFLRLIGDKFYTLLLFLNRWANWARKHCGYSYYSLANHIKTRVGKAEQAIRLFEDAAFQEVEDQNVDGIICGHIHHPNMIQRGDKLYCNDGDWVENCTALVETRNGTLELLHWADKKSYLSQLIHESTDSSHGSPIPGALKTAPETAPKETPKKVA